MNLSFGLFIILYIALFVSPNQAVTCPCPPTPGQIISLNSQNFPHVFLRIGGGACTQPSSSGCGTVNGQYYASNNPGPDELFLLHRNSDLTWCIISTAFPNLYLRIDGTSCTSSSSDGCGIVNTQYYNIGQDCGGDENFNIVCDTSGNWAIQSVNFPNVYLRIDGSWCTTFNSVGCGYVNAQYYPTGSNLIGYELFSTNTQLVNGFCCPTPNPGLSCINNSCCSSGYTCCREQCCPNLCCGGKCCQAGSSCCGGYCCPSGSTCCEGQCITPPTVCCGGNVVCPSSDRCVTYGWGVRLSPVCCWSPAAKCLDSKGDTQICCPEYQICADNVCTNPLEYCPNYPGQRCPGTSVCFYGDTCCPSGTFGCGEQMCCDYGLVCSNNHCCPNGQWYSNGICCSSTQQNCNGHCIDNSETCCPVGQSACGSSCCNDDVMSVCCGGTCCYYTDFLPICCHGNKCCYGI